MRTRSLLLVLIGALGCSGTDTTAPPQPVVRPGPPGTPKPLPPPDLVIRPAGVQALTFGAETISLPAALAGGAVHFGVQDDGRVLVGGAAGLFAIEGTGTSSISGLFVLGIFESEAVGFLVATVEGVYVYDGTLIPSQLDEALDDERVAHFTARGDELWFASSQRLYMLDETALYAFDEMRGVEGLATFDGGPIAIATSSSGYSMLVPSGSDWQQLSFDEEIALSQLAPGSGNRTIGISDGKLVERVTRSRDGEIVWRRLSIVDDPMDAGAESVERLVVDPENGAVWVVQDGLASRLVGDRVGTIALPALGPIVAARVTVDGGLWLSDGASLVRIGSDEPPLSFAEHVQPFNEKNCMRCHAPMLGISTLVLETAADWTANIDEIIDEVESGRMPLDQMPLVGGSAELPRRWLSGGMQP